MWETEVQKEVPCFLTCNYDRLGPATAFLFPKKGSCWPEAISWGEK